MPNSWRGKVLLPMEWVVQAIEGALDRLGSTYQKSYGVSLGRRVEVFSVTAPLGFTIRVREAGLRSSYMEPHRDSALSISSTGGSLPFLRSFVLEFARRLPHPPWRRDKSAREAAHKTWRKVFAVSALLIGLGLLYLFFTPPHSLTSLTFIMLIVNLAGVAVPLALIVLTHPEVESRIQRWRWGRWTKEPEFAALGWNDRFIPGVTGHRR